MSTVIRTVVLGTFAFVLVFLSAGHLWSQDATAATTAKSLESLLKDSPYAYREVKEKEKPNAYRVYVEIEGKVSVLMAQEFTAWKGRDGSDVKRIAVYAWIAPVAEGFKPSPAFLKKVAELNTNRFMGRARLCTDGLEYQNTFWLRTADVQILVDELAAAHYAAEYMKKELQPFLSEAAAEN